MKIRSLREDTLALLLSFAGIQSGITSLVVDGFSGIVTAAIAERIQGNGRIFWCHPGGRRDWGVVPILGVDRQCITLMSMDDIYQSLKDEDSNETHEIQKKDCDSVVIACRYDPAKMLRLVYPFLAPSKPFAIYCEYFEVSYFTFMFFF